MDDVQRHLALAIELRSQREPAQREQRCVMCAAACSRSDFRDELSWREYAISALCQKCQDRMFD